MKPSAPPPIISRWPPITAMVPFAWLLKSSTGIVFGVAIQRTLPVRLSKATYRCRRAAWSPQPVPTTLMITRSSSMRAVWVRPPNPELRPISSPSRHSQTVLPCRSKQTSWPSPFWA